MVISPEWVESVEWGDRSIFVNVSKDHIEQSSEYDPNITLDRDYETALYSFYGLPYYR